MKVFYFTATGNSLYVAKSLGGEAHSIPQMLKEERLEFEDEAIGIVFPCYYSGMPRLVIDFLKKASLKADYYFAIMTYGNIAASGLNHIEEIAGKSGIEFDYTAEILMVDNYLPLFEMEDQRIGMGKKKIEENLARIAEEVSSRSRKRTRKGVLSASLSKLVHLFYKNAVDGSDKKYFVGENCNGCKVCEKVCPKKNILVEGKAKFLHRCDACYACLHHCPQNAIHLKNERSKARYINQNIKLKEIIEANNQ